MTVRNFAEIILRGISQVFLLNNATTGILFLGGAFYNSRSIGLGAVIGVLVGTFTALFLKYNGNDINRGLYGYNSALVGLAIIYLFGFNMPSVIAVIVGSILSTILMRLMSKWKLPPYTAPFIISAWVVMAITLTLHIIPLRTAQLSAASDVEIIPAISKGIGQVMFQENTIAGIIIFIGILVCSRISALYALLGSSLGVVVSLIFSFPLNMINVGLFGFNGVLCGIALSNRKWHYLFLAIVAIVTSVFITYGMMHFGIITLTSPFVMSTWLALLLKNKIKLPFCRRLGEIS